MQVTPHILFNGLSMGTGGGLTVGRYLSEGLARLDSGWHITLLLTQDNPVHEELRPLKRPDNLTLSWAPPETRRLWSRHHYERRWLPDYIRNESVSAVVQLNGMLVPNLPVPSFCHIQDPWPYRTLLHHGPRRRTLAWLKRRQHAYAMHHAPAVGFTSQYLQGLCNRYHAVKPRRQYVLPNGLPNDWLIRANQPFKPWGDRPMEILTVGSVADHKRQHVVVEALADLVRRPHLKRLTYRIIGNAWWKYEDQVRATAYRLRVADRVVLEGRVSESRVREAFDSARAFVFMSVCESFGIPLIEAMSHGTPVVAARCCALPEVAGDAAVLVEPDDPAALAEALGLLLTNETQAENLRELGRRRLDVYRWDDTCSKLRDALGELLD